MFNPRAETNFYLLNDWTVKTIKCTYCGQKHDFKCHHIQYKIRIVDKKTREVKWKYFCSYECKRKYMREHKLNEFSEEFQY